MADKTYTIVIRADGSLALKTIKDINSEAEKFTDIQGDVQKAQKKTTKGANDYVKRNKGVGDATNNSTHAFSKMAQQMNGIVPIYATVAANVFAITAAFGAMERAADFKILIDSADSLAVQTGRSLTSLADNMKTITGDAISMKEALVSASIAASAGFDNSTIEQLTQVARNASVALGREMTDALNRVFKGAIKAEPELLDELGIILRLETAANKYATAMGKTAKELTTFEKQQAVVNEVLDQGEKKFGRLSKVDPNPFTQLSAAFSDITTELVNLVNAPIGGFIGFFTTNVEALTAAIVLLAASIAKQALPAISAMAESTVAAFTNVANGSKRASDAFKAFSDKVVNSQVHKSISETLTNTFKGLDRETRTVGLKKVFDEALDPAKRVSSAIASVTGQMGVLTRQLKSGKIGTAEWFLRTQELKSQREELLKLNKTVEAGTVRVNTFAAATSTMGKAVTFATGAISLGASAMASFAFSLSDTAQTVFKTHGAIQSLVAIGVDMRTTFEKNGGKTIGAISAMGSAIGGVGAGLLKMVPIISIATIAWQVLGSAFRAVKKLLGFEDIAKVTEKLEDQATALEKSAESALNFQENLADLPGTLSNISEQLTLQTNVLAGMAGELKKVNEAISLDGGFGWWDELLDTFNAGQIDIFKDNIDKLVTQIDQLGFGDEISEDVRELADSWMAWGSTAEASGKQLEVLVKDLQRISNGAKEANQAIIDGVDELNKSTSKLFGELPSLGGIDQTLIKVTDLATRLDGKDFEAVADTLSGLSSLTIKTLGLETTNEELAKFTQFSESSKLAVEALQGVLEKIKEGTGPVGLSIGTVEEQIERTNEALKVQEDIISNKLSEPLDSAIKKFKEISNAARNLKDALTTLNLDKLNPLNTGADTVAILRKETDLRVNAIAIQTKAARKGIQDIATDNKELEADRLDALERYYRYKEGAEANQKLRQEAESDLGVLATRANANAELEKKLQLQLDKTRGQSAALVQKLYESTAKEIDRVVEQQAKGVTGLESTYTELNNSLNSSLGTLTQLTGKTEEWAKSMIVLRKGAENLQTFLTRERIDSAKALNEQAYAMESTNITMMNQLAVSKALNGELWSRADAQWQITDAIKEAEIALQQSRVNQASDAIDSAGITSPENEAALDALYQKEKAQLDALTNARKVANENNLLSLSVQADKTITTMEAELKFLQQKGKLGVLFSKADADALKIAKLKAKLKGNDPKDIEKIISLQKKLNKEVRKFEFAEKLQEAAESMNNLADGMNGVFEALRSEDSFDDFSAGLMLLKDIGNDIGGPLGNFAEGLSVAGAAAQQYSEQMSNIADATYEAREAGNGELTQLQEKNFALQEQQATYGMLANAAGGLAASFEEGSSAAKAFTLVQQASAIASAAAAVAHQGTAGDPYSAPARVAAMLALLASVLGAAGIAFGGGSGSGADAAKGYEDRMGSDALRDRDVQSNYLVDSLDDLIEIDTQLFSATRDLQIEIKNLADIFEGIGAVIYGSIAGQSMDSFGLIGESTAQNNEGLVNALADIGGAIGDVFTLGLGGDIIGGLVGDIAGGLFGSTSTSTSVLDAGLNFSSIITATEDGLRGFFNTLQQETVVLVRTESSSWFSSSSSSSVQSVFQGLDTELSNALGMALDHTLGVVNGLISGLGEAIGGIDLGLIFGNVSGDIFGEEFISLFELSAEDAGAAVALYFSTLSSDIIGEVLPWLSDFSKAGEEFGDTLVRITGDTIKLSQSLATVGLELSDVIGSLDVSQSLFDSASFRQVIGDTMTTLQGALASTSAALAAEKNSYFYTYDGDLEDTVKVYKNPENIAALESTMLDIQTQIVKTMVDALVNNRAPYMNEIDKAAAAAAESFKLQVVAAWEEELLSNFKDIDEFQELFARFSKAIFSESELLEQSITNATDNVANGFTALADQVNSISGLDIASELESNGGDFGAALRTFYEDALDTGLFNADILNGTEIDTVGASIFATFVKLGASINILDELLQGIQDEIDDLNNTYVQQILLFGKAEKAAALLSLAFDFNDAIKEAEETGSDLALVEQAYGLERLQIIKDAFEEINNEIESAMSSVLDSVIEVSSSFDLWDDLAFATIKINKLVDQLKKGASGINLDSLIGDTAGFEDFVNEFQNVIDALSTEGPNSISDEIALVDDLRDSIIDRYSLELSLLEEQKDAYKALSDDIQSYLSDLIISDASPLTNFERLNEATDQFMANASDIFSSDPDAAAQAASDILSSADALLEQASLFYAIGPEYNKIFDLVTSTLSGIDAELLVKKDDTVLAIEALNTDIIDQLGVLDSILVELQNQNQETLELDIASNITEGMAPLIGTITDKLQSIDDGSWTNIVSILDTIATASVPTYESVFTPSAEYQTDTLGGDTVTVPTYAMGTAEIPVDMLAQVHQGETIVPESMAQGLREGTLSMGEVQDNSDVVDAIKQLTFVLADSQDDIVTATNKNIEISQEIASSVSTHGQTVATKGMA